MSLLKYYCMTKESLMNICCQLFWLWILIDASLQPQFESQPHHVSGISTLQHPRWHRRRLLRPAAFCHSCSPAHSPLTTTHTCTPPPPLTRHVSSNWFTAALSVTGQRIPLTWNESLMQLPRAAGLKQQPRCGEQLAAAARRRRQRRPGAARASSGRRRLTSPPQSICIIHGSSERPWQNSQSLSERRSTGRLKEKQTAKEGKREWGREECIWRWKTSTKTHFQVQGLMNAKMVFFKPNNFLNHLKDKKKT